MIFISKHNMKKIITFLTILMITLSSNTLDAQTIKYDPKPSVALGVYFDGKLMFSGDEEHGIPKYTPDIRIELDLHGNQTKVGYTVIGMTFGHAQLSKSDFLRYGFQGGFTFNDINFFDVFEFEVTPLAGVGVISRNGVGWVSLEGTLELTFMMTDWLSINLKGTMMQRGDLAMFGDEAASYNPVKWRPNLYGGVKFHL
jgi:hypothetical protein